MAVTEGRKGKVTVRTTGGTVTVSEQGKWGIKGWQRSMIEHSAFQDTAKKFTPSILDPGSIDWDGYFDPSNSSGQMKLIQAFTSGKPICNSSVYKLRKMRFWGNTDTSLGNKGFWSATGSSAYLYLTDIQVGQDKAGLGTISFTAKVSGGVLAWSCST